MTIYNWATYISATLIITIGSLALVCLLLYPAWYLFNSVLYKRIQGSLYFVDYIRHRKKFIEWYKKHKRNVQKSQINKDESKLEEGEN